MRHASRLTHQSGVALVVTLLLLSIITFMAVTFLVVSRSQRGSVVTETDLATARLAASTALERAKVDLVARIMATTNEFNYGLVASTNFINLNGFTNNSRSPFNVNYDFDSQTRLPLTAAEQLQNIANLLYDPRPPVYITNRLFANSNDFRFYIDINRNGRYDTNGLQPELDVNGNPIALPGGGGYFSNSFVGDPEWIGTLLRPEYPHSADNEFVSRYAYVAVPIGNTLDINYMHNQARNPTKTSLGQYGQDYLRDQGIGTWEINMAAFLYDLNTNFWGGLYNDGYNPVNFTFSDPQGNAFVDAGSLLAYRYNVNLANPNLKLASVSTLFSNGPGIFHQDGVDGYTSTTLLNAPGFAGDPDLTPADLTKRPWPGADNPNHFNSPQDLFDENKTAPFVTPANLPTTMTLTKRLQMASTNSDSYNRDTFYRLLSQLSTESAPEPPGKLNLNYCNVDNNGNVVPHMETNFIPWQPDQFFTNAAVRLLANAGYTAGTDPTSVTNLLYASGGVTNLHIPIWPTNLYTPSVHRMLQLAANIYDASTNRTFNVAGATNGFPSVFQPVFTALNGGNQVFITGYREVGDSDVWNYPLKDLSLAADRTQLNAATQMAWGVPLVIGAKKGLPNFNKFAMHTQLQVTRKLQYHRPGTSVSDPVNEIDQMFVVGITNSFSVEAWNSYQGVYPRPLTMAVFPVVTVTLTNLDTGKQLVPAPLYVGQKTLRSLPANTWAGYRPESESYSFILPLASGPGVPFTNVVFLSNSTYRVSTPVDSFVPLTGDFERTPGRTNFYLPRWQMAIRARVSFALIDSGRIVDYVNLDSTQDTTDPNLFNISETLSSDSNCGDVYTPNGSRGAMWCTNRMNNSTDPSVATFGIQNQIEASLGHVAVDWNDSRNEFPAGMSKDQAIVFFKGQFIPGYLRSSNTFAAPFQPFRNVYKITEWQANDPLVHYTINDLKDLQRTNTVKLDNPEPRLVDTLAQINRRYEPWGGNPKLGANNAAPYDVRVKDPIARTFGRSDDWDFPTNKFPNVGVLGRVHRGTPWQTIYLKAYGSDTPSWLKWSGDGQIVPNIGQISPNLVPVATNLSVIPNNSLYLDAAFSQPTNDWRLLDLFTAALDDNATHGQLSINQTNLAAWSAVLSGVMVLTNAPYAPGGVPALDNYGRNIPTPLTVQPAGIYDAADPTTWPPLVRILNGINTTRTNFPHQAFQTLGDVLAVPELSVASPFVNTNALPTDVGYAFNDAVCERIPQQILGLLKCDHTPRFVVYAFGQTLKPAAKVPSGQFFGLTTNYQIVAESATRAVVRIDGAPNRPRAVVESFSVLPPD